MPQNDSKILAAVSDATREMFRIYHKTKRGKKARKLMLKSERLSHSKSPIHRKRSRDAGKAGMRLLIAQAETEGLNDLTEMLTDQLDAMIHNDRAHALAN